MWPVHTTLFPGTPPPLSLYRKISGPQLHSKTADLRSLSSDLIRVRKPGCPPLSNTRQSRR